MRRKYGSPEVIFRYSFPSNRQMSESAFPPAYRTATMSAIPFRVTPAASTWKRPGPAPGIRAFSRSSSPSTR